MPSSAEAAVDLLAAARMRPVTERFASDDSEDLVLVRAARDGDRAAFGRLYERYARTVHGVLLARVPAIAVDDLVQDVFIRALRRLNALRKNECFGAWLCAIARNMANDFHRRSLPEEPMPETLEIADENANTDHQRDAAIVLAVIRSLPDVYRETLILRLVEGMTGPEIAERTGLTHGSVRVNLHRGMQQLRAALHSNRSGNEREQETL
jgi:RNA polymerase sigma-70 factor (ECF subfamily)